MNERPRKRRAINACVSCRASKVRCDGNRPCHRCDRNDVACIYHDAVKDENVLRLEQLEANVSALQDEMSNISNRCSSRHVEPAIGSDMSSHHRQEGPNNAIETGLIDWDQAASWFESFFSGSQFLVPVFCERQDTIEYISRNAFLFDAIVSIGCRAEQGFSSRTYRRLQAHVREHLTSLLTNLNVPSLEDVQAITLIAAYSDNGFVLIALAIRFAIQLGLPNAIEQLWACSLDKHRTISVAEQELYRLSRVWLGICNFELFFSLDGGKIPSNTLQTSPRKIRTLVSHPDRTAVDIRLLSQIELNTIRTDAYSKITSHGHDAILPRDESKLKATINDSCVELSLWLGEWTDIVSSGLPIPQQSLALQNLHIQREWALLTMFLKATAVSGIENIAIMSDYQKDLISQAKEAAARHLNLVVSPTAALLHSDFERTDGLAYLDTFKWTFDYVWAKCSFSVLIVLKLAILLRDPITSVMSLLHDSHVLLEELKKVSVGHIAYFQILQTSVAKCEAALKEHTTCRTDFEGLETSVTNAERVAEDEFQGYVPNEFVFEWDFPGLNLKHMPLGW